MDISHAYLLEQERYKRKIITKKCSCCIGLCLFMISFFFAKLQIYFLNKNDDDYLTDLSLSQ